MDDTKKMLRMIINGQSALKDELLRKIDKLEDKLEGKINGVDRKLDRVEKNLTKRIDRLGSQLAYLEDDTSTKEEFDALEKRVGKVEVKVASM